MACLFFPLLWSFHFNLGLLWDHLLQPSETLVIGGDLLTCLYLDKSYAAYKVLLIGGTRFSRAAVWKELYEHSHTITVYNHGKTKPRPLTNESRGEFYKHMTSAKFLEGNHTSPSQFKALIDTSKYKYVYDMNARKVEDVAPLAEIFVGKEQFKQYVLMSSTGVYMASEEMPHVETDPTDPQSCHEGN
eukprot:5224864-Ditylum_brightwellii.AAC.1